MNEREQGIKKGDVKGLNSWSCSEGPELEAIVAVCTTEMKAKEETNCEYR